MAFSRDMPRSGIAGPSGSYIWNLHTALHSGCTNLHSPQQCRKTAFYPHPLQHLSFGDFWWWLFWPAWGGTSLWFWFVFSWWSVMLSIFACACWPSVSLLWRNVYLGLLPIFLVACLVFFDRVAWAVCIFWRLIPCWQLHLQIFVPFCGLSFYFVYGFLCCAEDFMFN